MATPAATTPVLTASDVARYFLALAAEDGDLITNLKMQKLVYYAYVWTLIQNDRKLFGESIQAWANGPVVPSLYRKLREYGAGPIGEDFLGTEQEINDLVSRIPPDVLETLNGVYEQYMRMSAFELVTRTHNELPWKEARRGLAPTDRCDAPIRDEHIIAQFVPD